MPRKALSEDAFNPKLAAQIPWWGWTVLGIGIWLIAHAMTGLDVPRQPTPATLASTALVKGFGYFASVLGPMMCVWFAIVSAVHRAKAAKSRWLDQRVEPGIGVPTPGTSEPESRPYIDTSRWSPELLKALEWKRFEQICALYFRTLKFRVEEAAVGPDGGIDLRLFAYSPSGHTSRTPDIIVQCKAWNTWKVGVEELREHFGVMAAESVNEGIFVTTSSFSDEAAIFARGKNIALIDGDDLFRKICDLPPEDQLHLLAAATSGNFTTPTCPSCGAKMLKRNARDTNERFWGCSAFPRCRRTMPIAGGCRHATIN